MVERIKKSEKGILKSKKIQSNANTAMHIPKRYRLHQGENQSKSNFSQEKVIFAKKKQLRA